MRYIGVVASAFAKGATMPKAHFRLLCIASMLVLGAQQAPAASETYDPWPGLVQDIFSNRAMNDGSEVIAIEMPYRAEDAAIVPVTLKTKLPPGDSRRVVSITLVIDQNPAPMAAKSIRSAVSSIVATRFWSAHMLHSASPSESSGWKYSTTV